MRTRRVRRALNLLLLVAACTLAAWLGYRAAWEWQLARLHDAGRQRLVLFARSLESVLDKYEHLPFMIGLHKDAIRLLRDKDPALVPAVNELLKQAQAGTEVTQFYLLDTAGTAVASSQQRLIGNNYEYRPYFRQAMAGGAGLFYSVGTTTLVPGCFRSRPVRDGDRIIGVAAITFSLNGVERGWAESGERVALVDENGVVVLSTTESWKYRALKPLSEEVRKRVVAARQYPEVQIRPLAAEALDVLPEGVVVDGAKFPEGRGKWLAQSYLIGGPGWGLMLFSDLREVRETAVLGGVGAGFAAAFLASLFVYGRLRKKSRRDRREAAEALKRVSEDLERRIEERTAQLSNANQQLHEKVNDLEKTEAILRKTTDDAVQAGKLAVLGQLAAGVSHELNQPLSALQMLAGNGVTLLEMGETDEVRGNLQAIGELVGRLGHIVGPLKSFARKSPLELVPVRLGAAIDNALMLLSAVTARTPVKIEVSIEPPDLHVLADSVRLEQVLVNLIRNGVQAMMEEGGGGDLRIEITATSDAGIVRLVIRDYGPGFSADTLAHLFEPFYTTKPTGEGLGLGLTISRAIIERLGGTLRAENAEPGARFEILLKDATP
ncbi:MAG TPA: ATP-binding protein [Aromatoleum sp.]|uniref:ATP-binding protein n=1 Tax=Aromatoleum sp. TaxID=2307007 RepID=UPI002B4A12BC|nr:ATP-binding protein [Aromatoleum sp.]HJV24522.1 ATP-binding protein [Aromatoleum sp.]